MVNVEARQWIYTNSSYQLFWKFEIISINYPLPQEENNISNSEHENEAQAAGSHFPNFSQHISKAHFALSYCWEISPLKSSVCFVPCPQNLCQCTLGAQARGSRPAAQGTAPLPAQDRLGSTSQHNRTLALGTLTAPRGPAWCPWEADVP